VPKQILTLIRGLPGSGKTTLAKAIVEAMPNTKHYEADQYFTDAKTGVYKFDKNKLATAHDSCLKNTYKALIEGYNVVVSNTFVKLKTLDNYLTAAKLTGASVQIVICQGNFGSVHSVPQETIERYKLEFEF
jgi:predicted kinase